MSDLDEMTAQLLGQRLQPGERPAVDGPGVYALFLSDHRALSAVTVGDHDVLYVGMTGRNSKARSHFQGRSSGSSPRRSLGALLKDELQLTAYSRGRGLTKKDSTHYCFREHGEAALTAWMKRYLIYSYIVVSTNLWEVEKRLISRLTPPLNIDDDWDNPDQPLIDRLRKVCREEAAMMKASGE